MKKISTLLLLLCITVTLFGSPYSKSENIIFTGYIEGDIYFYVERLPGVSSFNLLTTEALLPDKSGVDIGKWTLRVDNPPITSPTFIVSYSYGPLVDPTESVADSIEFTLLERKADSDRVAQRKSGDTVTINISSEDTLHYEERLFAARLTEEGYKAAQRAAATDYESNITITLNTN